MTDTTPERLLAALTAAGWVEVGRWPEDNPDYADLLYRGLPTERYVQVPLRPEMSTYSSWLAGTLEQLERLATRGEAARRVLTEATCSCGGKRWVDDENWQPDHYSMGPRPVRRKGEGLIPCGGCNFGGWNEPIGDAE